MAETNDGEEEEGIDSVAIVLEEDWKPTTTTKPRAAEGRRNLRAEIGPVLKPFLDGGYAAIAWRAPLLLISGALMKAGQAVFESTPFPHNSILFSKLPSALTVVAIEHAMLLGPFEFFTRKIEAKNKGISPSLNQEVGCVVASSAIGAFVTTPFRLAFSHIQKANCISPNVVSDLYGKAVDEGTTALWKGGSPFASRLFVGNVAMLGSYYPSFIYLRESVGFGERRSVHVASIVSGLLTATCTYPFVYVQEAMEKMRLDVNGKKPYTGNYAECALRILKTTNNPLRIFRGSLPHFVACTINSMGFWYCYERFKNI